MRDERGIALAVALFALVIIGTLVAAALFVVRLELQSADGVLHAGTAFGAADAGVATTLATWPSTLSDLADGDSLVIPDMVPGLGATARVTGMVSRLNEALFLVRAEAVVRDSSGSLRARRVVAELVRLDRLHVPVRTALLARGAVAVEGSTALLGDNGEPPGWHDSLAVRGPCPPDSTIVPSIEAGGAIAISGSPVLAPAALQHAAAATDSVLFLTPFDTLVALADITVSGGVIAPSPGVAAGRCDRADAGNWGEPLAIIEACAGYYPVIHVTGDLTMDGGRGQGIMLVDGNAELRQDALFAGIIITRGTFRAADAAQVFGTVLANDATSAGAWLGGSSRLRLSACAIRRALGAATRPRPLGAHAWVPVY